MTPNRRPKDLWKQINKEMRPPLDQAPRLKEKDKLFGVPETRKTEMCIQTDDGGDLSHLFTGMKKQTSRKKVLSDKSVRIDEGEGEEASQPGSEDDLPATKRDPDSYVEDWINAILYKKMMKAEAIKRGLPYQQFEIDEDEREFDMSTVVDDKTETKSFLPAEGDMFTLTKKDMTPVMSHEASKPDLKPFQHHIGFLKGWADKGAIAVLTNSEVNYLKTLVKGKNTTFDSETTLDDIQRHTKFTIRMLSRQMANIDNKRIFRKVRAVTQPNVGVMVHRAGEMYEARDSARKIFQLLAKIIFDEEEFRVIEQTAQTFTAPQIMFLKKREQLIRRCLAQVTNFVGQFKMFHGKFQYDGQHLRDFLTELLERVQALTGMGEAVEEGHISAMSSHVHDKKSNGRNIR